MGFLATLFLLACCSVLSIPLTFDFSRLQGHTQCRVSQKSDTCLVIWSRQYLLVTLLPWNITCSSLLYPLQNKTLVVSMFCIWFFNMRNIKRSLCPCTMEHFVCLFILMSLLQYLIYICSLVPQMSWKETPFWLQTYQWRCYAPAFLQLLIIISLLMVFISVIWVVCVSMP